MGRHMLGGQNRAAPRPCGAGATSASTRVCKRPWRRFVGQEALLELQRGLRSRPDKSVGLAVMTPRIGWQVWLEARRRDAAARVPFSIDGVVVGAVARVHLPALRAHADTVSTDAQGVRLIVAPSRRDAALERINAHLREAGLIHAWRDEVFPLFDPVRLTPLARMERAAARFWGTLTLGAHATGYVADAAGRPSRLWIAKRSMSKATDPGKFDNLVGGGVRDGHTPWMTLQREAWEEAGLARDRLRSATAGSVLELHRDVAEGLQHEWLYSYDLAMPAGLIPSNLDGEVAAFECLALSDALALAADDAMTVDAALVTLDFALRHALLSAAQAQQLRSRMRSLRVDAARAGVQSI